MKGSDKKKGENEGGPHKPLVTCAGDWNLFCSLEAILDAAIPQDRCEWHRSYGRTTKDVYVEAAFTQFKKENLVSNENGWSLLKRPIFHIYWTDCVDLESYKTTLRDDVESWLKQLNQKDISDWLIVLVETYDFRKTNKLLPRTTVLDKLRSDFTTKQTEDRCISVINPIKSESRSAESWRGLAARIRHLILVAYNKTLVKFEEYMREQRERRNDPEWDFIKYFVLQEQLAFVLESLSLYDESLLQYDELDALFTQFILNSTITQGPKWLEGFRKPVESWYCVKLGPLAPTKLREKIVSGKGTLLDFRSYLYQRQCAMLMLEFKPWEMLIRCLATVQNTAREMSLLEVAVTAGGVASWALLCCTETLNAVLRLLKSSQNLPRDKVDLCTAHQAPIYHLAKDKLYELGKLCGLLPGTPDPTSDQLHLVVMVSAGMEDVEQRSSVSRLKEALCSKVAFHTYYLELAELACGTYKHHGNMRFARLIGRELAAFYSELGEMSKAVVFLLDALRSYEDEGWKQLAAQTRLELVACYKKMEDRERYTKLCASISCTAELEILVRHFYFDEMMKSLAGIAQNRDAILCDMNECFRLFSLKAVPNARGPYVADNKVEFHLVIDSWFPRQIFCQKLAISLELENPEETKTPSKSNKLDSKSASPSPRKIVSDSQNNVQYISSIAESDLKQKNPFTTKLVITSNLHHKEDGSLDRATIECLNPKSLLVRADSVKFRKPSNANRADYTLSITLASQKITPGLNDLYLEFTPKVRGLYKLGQISVLVEDRLDYLSDVLVGRRLGFEVVVQNPGVILNKADPKRELLAGLEHDMDLIVMSGSSDLAENSEISLETSRGLTVRREGGQMANKLSFTVAGCKPFNSITIPLKMFAHLTNRKDDKSAEYKVWILCPWSTQRTEVTLNFAPPFAVTHRLLTCETRKYIYATIKCAQPLACRLKGPKLACLVPDDVRFADLNPNVDSFSLTTETSSLNFLWELEHDPLQKPLPVKAELSFCYEFDGDACSRAHTTPLELKEYATLFVVRSGVMPCKGKEFCRASAMCRLHIAVHRINETDYTSLMYEVLTDQTIWAVCGRTAGVLTVSNGDIEPQSVVLDVMPLCSGYLPLPTVRLSKYIVPEDVSHPRLEPFSPGQVYHAAKALQVHVLPAVNDN